MGEITQNRNMSFIKVTDSGESKSNMFYLHSQITPLVNRLNGKSEINCEKDRCVYKLWIDKTYTGFIRAEIEDRIADVVAVNYKYQFFKQNINIRKTTIFFNFRC